MKNLLIITLVALFISPFAIAENRFENARRAPISPKPVQDIHIIDSSHELPSQDAQQEVYSQDTKFKLSRSNFGDGKWGIILGTVGGLGPALGDWLFVKSKKSTGSVGARIFYGIYGSAIGLAIGLGIDNQIGKKSVENSKVLEKFKRGKLHQQLSGRLGKVRADGIIVDLVTGIMEEDLFNKYTNSDSERLALESILYKSRDVMHEEFHLELDYSNDPRVASETNHSDSVQNQGPILTAKVAEKAKFRKAN